MIVARGSGQPFPAGSPPHLLDILLGSLHAKNAKTTKQLTATSHRCLSQPRWRDGPTEEAACGGSDKLVQRKGTKMALRSLGAGYFVTWMTVDLQRTSIIKADTSITSGISGDKLVK